MATRGYAATTVADVAAAAAVSQLTFYEHYEDKLDCYLQTLVEFCARLARESDEHAHGGLTPETLTARLRGALGTMAVNPDLTHCLLFELPDTTTVRPDYSTVLRGAFIGVLRHYLDATDDFAADAFAVMTRQLIAEEVSAGRCAEVAALAPRVVDMLDVYRRGLLAGAT